MDKPAEIAAENDDSNLSADEEGVPHFPMLLPAEVKTEPNDQAAATADCGADIEAALAAVLGQDGPSADVTIKTEKPDDEPSVNVPKTPHETEAAESCRTEKESATAEPEPEQKEKEKQTQSLNTTLEAPTGSLEGDPGSELPDSFFEDLLQSADDIKNSLSQNSEAPGDSSKGLSAEPTTFAVKEEPPAEDVNINNEGAGISSDVISDPQGGRVAPNDGRKAGSTEPTSATVKEEPSTAEANTSAEAEGISADFFDDLLVDHVAERMENAANDDLEIKFSERLKELQQLENQEARKSHKKKKKKKSHKRSHSRNDDDESHKRPRQSRSRSRSPSDVRTPRISIKPEFMLNTDESCSAPRTGSMFPHEPAPSADLPSSSSHARPFLRVKTEFAIPSTSVDVIDVEELCLPVKENELFTRRNMNGVVVDLAAPLGFKRIKLEKDANEISHVLTEPPLHSLTPAAKRERAIKRAVAAIEEFKKARERKPSDFSSFMYTSMVRKLPSNHSIVTQEIYDYRSPLHTVNNVSFKFNSNATRFNLREWGLEALTPAAARVAKVLGYDAHTLWNKTQAMKFPPQLQRIKRERNEQASEEVEEVRSSFFTNAMTQTDESILRRRNGHDIGVQAVPYCSSIGVQTKETATSSLLDHDELPLMQQIKMLNENQLLALSDFAELIREPETNVMDMYRLRQRMLDIYKCSKLPSALAPQPSSANQHYAHRPQVYNAPMPPQPARRDPRQQAAATHQMHPHPTQYNSYPQRPLMTPAQTYHPHHQQPPPPPVISNEGIHPPHLAYNAPPGGMHAAGPHPPMHHHQPTGQGEPSRFYGRGAKRR